MPLAARQEGIGHLRRSAALAADWPEATLVVAPTEAGAAAEALVGTGSPITSLRTDSTFGARGEHDLVIADRRSSNIRDLLSWGRRGTVVGLDEGGPARRYMPVIVDTLPNLAADRANLASVALLSSTDPDADADRRRRETATESAAARCWIVSFGGDDGAHLSQAITRMLLCVAPAGVEVVVVAGPRFGARLWPPGARVMPPQARLADVLRTAEIVFTSYGLTAFEALALGVPVVLASPTRYHERLALAADLPSLGLAVPWHPRRHRRSLARLLRNLPRLQRPVGDFAERRRTRPDGGLAGYLRRLRPTGPRDCPACGCRLSPAVARLPDRTYRRCRRCDLIHMLRFDRPGIYDRAYFFADYAQQYGRTYLEDFDHIRTNGFARLRKIAALLPPGERKPMLVDIGCAFGPFLDAARRRGWEPAGLDVSADAVDYVRQQLHLPAMVGDVERLSVGDLRSGLLLDRLHDEGSAGQSAIAAVTMWFVIEHVVDVGSVLTSLHGLLRPGGVFAFSTPNGKGISARLSPLRFFDRSPADHYTIWTRRAARRVLNRYGFRVRRIHVTGHHPERFPFAAGPGWVRLLYRGAAALVSRVLGLGDTFEVYAIRQGED